MVILFCLWKLPEESDLGQGFLTIFSWLSVMCDMSTEKEGTNHNLLPEPQSPGVRTITPHLRDRFESAGRYPK